MGHVIMLRLFLWYLQVVISHHAQERYDGVQYGQTAEGWRHVTCALLQDEVLQRTLLFLLAAPPPTVPRVLVIARHLEREESVTAVAAESSSSNIAASIYFVEEQDEVDRKGHEERQETEVVEVPGQIVLWKERIFVSCTCLYSR